MNFVFVEILLICVLCLVIVCQSASPKCHRIRDHNGKRPKHVSSHYKAKVDALTICDARIRFGQFPSELIITWGKDDGEWCTAILLDERHVLTEAKCLVKAEKKGISKLFATYIDTWPEGEDTSGFELYSADSVCYPKTFNKKGGSYGDYGIIKLKREFKSNDIVYPVCLTDTEPKIGDNLLVYGWGIQGIHNNITDFENHHEKPSFLNVHAIKGSRDNRQLNLEIVDGDGTQGVCSGKLFNTHSKRL